MASGHPIWTFSPRSEANAPNHWNWVTLGHPGGGGFERNFRIKELLRSHFGRSWHTFELGLRFIHGYTLVCEPRTTGQNWLARWVDGHPCSQLPDAVLTSFRLGPMTLGVRPTNDQRAVTCIWPGRSNQLLPTMSLRPHSTPQGLSRREFACRPHVYARQYVVGVLGYNRRMAI